MNILYFDCMSGISGVMAVGAFLDMGIKPEALAGELTEAHIPALYDIEAEKTEKQGVRATAFRARVSELYAPFRLSDAESTVAASGLDPAVKRTVLRILQMYTDARARIFGPEDEPDGAEAVTDLVNIISVAACIHWLNVGKIICSPLTEGGGFAETRHGLSRVPVPAVLEMMRMAGAPLQICAERTQLVTPVGAAIVCALAGQFGEMPSMTEVSAVGFGAGTKDLDTRANVLRVILGKNEYKFYEESVCLIDTDTTWYGGGAISSGPSRRHSE